MDAATLARFGYKDMHQLLNWRWYKKYGGGPIVDLGSHQIDVFNWFLGTRPRNVMASGGLDYDKYKHHEWPDNVMCIFEYATDQGTVWAWLTGPFIEAYLKVEGGNRLAVERARQWLAAFDAHLRHGGLGFISEIFDGDAPHTHRGCIAQAWSVAEVLRARMLVEEYARKVS